MIPPCDTISADAIVCYSSSGKAAMGSVRTCTTTKVIRGSVMKVPAITIVDFVIFVIVNIIVAYFVHIRPKGNIVSGV